jgi:BNR repeat-like domain
MSSYKTQTLRVLGSLSICLLMLSGCGRGAPEAGNQKVMPGLSQPVRVSPEETDAAEPAIATAPDGSAYVAWVSHAKTEADVMVARFTSDGQMQGQPVRVNPQVGIATAWRGDPPTVAVAPDQTVFVGWTARVESASGHASDIYLSSSKDHGQTFGVPVKVNDDSAPAVHGMHSLTVANDGRLYMAWLDERNVNPTPTKDMKMDAPTAGHHMESNRELFFAASTDGGRSFSKNQRVATNVCPCCKTALATSFDGRLYLSWRQVLPGDFRHIAVASSPDHGQTFTTPVIVSDDQWVLAGCPVSGATLSIAGDGFVRVLWYSEGKNGQTGLYWSGSRDQGATFGPRQLLAAETVRGTPALIGDADNLAAVWQDTGNKTARVMIAPRIAEATQPNSFVVTSNGELPAATANNERLFVVYVAKGTTGQNVWLVSAGKRG